eukprot:ANDGO_06532.mRNA.1 Dynein heavy chain
MLTVLSELREMKKVWTECFAVSNRIDAIRDLPFSGIVPRKLRAQIDEVLAEVSSLPAWMHSYPALQFQRETLESFKKCHGIIVDLRSDFVKDRHWALLFRKLNSSKPVSIVDITLGYVYDLKPLTFDMVFKEVIRSAQGEFALEVFLSKVAESWESCVVELVTYKSRCSLIKGWDDLSSKMSEHLNSLTAMKQSPFYFPFKDTAEKWEDRLSRIRVLVDVWSDVQRRWVYLEGIFGGVSAADIRMQLPAEANKFSSVDSEFVRLMKKVQQNPRFLEVFDSNKDLLKVLERIADSLSKIQKSLGDYLEKQRSSFPRFYFIGDEDLLEMLAQAADVARVSKHLRKMFAGVASLNCGDNSIVSVVSLEGEELGFVTPVVVLPKEPVHAWLTRLNVEIQASLLSAVYSATEQLFAIARAERSAFSTQYVRWFDSFPCQAALLASQVWWTSEVEKSLSTSNAAKSLVDLADCLGLCIQLLTHENVSNADSRRHKKAVSLITELVHERDVARHLISLKCETAGSFDWLCFFRYYLSSSSEKGRNDAERSVLVRCANAEFVYGLEYFGIEDRLVQTPLTDRAFLTLTQALHSRLGGSPFGPAGTGKTETVKALGQALGRFTLVFNCDDTFDVRSMGRIFVGLCQCGAWGCFDEFNRLEESILSAVSQQIQLIQVAIRAGPAAGRIELIGRHVQVRPETGIFVTMNPGYAGRRNLPDNLKQLFRSFAMIQPDKELIAQVMLYAQGFQSAEKLSQKIVPFFTLCFDQLSKQSHYDFGLRALKSVLVTAGNIKREVLKSRADLHSSSEEFELIVTAICDSLIPKLVPEDVPLLRSLLMDVFRGTKISSAVHSEFVAKISNLCQRRHLISSEMWLDKAVQVYQISKVHHGLMVVGPAGSGKSSLWQLALEAGASVEGLSARSYILDPKSLTKEELYGYLDPTTRDWSDGVFTKILRKIADAPVSDVTTCVHWIVFDGDVDPEWVENLNSVLDDNKLLTLPNGERISLPRNVRLVFEVQDLKQATLATVSRCGMIWFADGIVSPTMRLNHFALSCAARASTDPFGVFAVVSQRFRKLFVEYELFEKCWNHVNSGSFSGKHIMDVSLAYGVEAVSALMMGSVQRVLDWSRDSNMPLPLDPEFLVKFCDRQLLLAVVWGLGGTLPLSLREEFAKFVGSTAPTVVPDLHYSGPADLLQLGLEIETAEMVSWSSLVPNTEVEASRAGSPDVVIPTVDTVRHEEVLRSWMNLRVPVILCGPPGSGKTMTLTSVLQRMPDIQVVSLSFSSATGPNIIFRTIERYCDIERTANGLVCRPSQPGKWLVIFCDEINLPSPDKYGTQRIISLIRQVVEMRGFWHPQSGAFVALERVQFVGACNPPSDPGRHPLSMRFLRHAPVLFVDFPSSDSLNRIYGTLMRAALRMLPQLSQLALSSSQFMVKVYSDSQRRFTPDMQPHYIYSPRELSRWMRAVVEVVNSSTQNEISGDTFVRLLVHEGLRLFHDRLVSSSEREWTLDLFTSSARTLFGNPSFFINLDVSLQQPILFSNWLTRAYVSVDAEELRQYVRARLKSFADEEMDVHLVVFDEVLNHVLRIDRVLRQPLGHLLLAGASGSGKTVLSRFVAWMNGLSVFQIKAHRGYTLADFEADLRSVLKRSGVKGEKICFIFDESNILDTAFLEYMNALLASGEVPGLFEGDELAALLNSCRESARLAEERIDSDDDLFKWFLNRVQRNLHIVLTMNPSNPDFTNRTATSPALFNRCVVDWFGDWNELALSQVASEFVSRIDLSQCFASAAEEGLMDHFKRLSSDQYEQESAFSVAASQSLVGLHDTGSSVGAVFTRRQGVSFFVTPRHFLDLIRHFERIMLEKSAQILDQQLHVTRGLEKLGQAELEVASLKASLKEYEERLAEKSHAANQKLSQMMVEQREAEEKKKTSEEMSVVVERRADEVRNRREDAEKELATVEPLVADAKEAVREIKKKQLDELRALPNPPAAVQFCLQAVCTMLGKEKAAADWEGIRRIIRDSDFIASIVEFDTSQIDEKLRKRMEKFMSNDLFDFDAVNRSSKACGPLVKWTKAQLSYSFVLERVSPLRQEVLSLQTELDDLRLKQRALIEMISELEMRISGYKEEYANLIAEAEHIKLEKSTVQSKAERSSSLLSNLIEERRRWDSQTKSFSSDMSTLVGDSLISSAFLAYAGYFDEYYRHSLLIPRWMALLDRLHIPYRPSLSLVDMLSAPSKRLMWASVGLPADDVCVENAVMLERFNRYPLIIDPTGQGVQFLISSRTAIGGSNAVVRVSFLDQSFMAALEDAIRCGTTLLVEDVEHLDPVLNPVLNREVQKTGGRMLVRVGAREVDLSPSFALYLITKNPLHQFSPDVSSRVTFVNFSVTPASLVSQSLALILLSERPDIENRRTEVLRSQGEYRVRLRNLEEELLNALSDSTANLLEDDVVLRKLETVKKEAFDVQNRMQETDVVMRDLSRAAAVYQPFAAVCSRIYFSLLRLSEINNLYQFSLDTFWVILKTVLSSPHAEGDRGSELRISSFIISLFSSAFSRIRRSLLYVDALALASRFSIMYAVDVCGVDISARESELLFHLSVSLEKSGSGKTAMPAALQSKLSASSSTALQSLLSLASFKLLQDQLKSQDATTMTAVFDILSAEKPEVLASQLLGSQANGQDAASKVLCAFHSLLLTKALRPDRLVFAMESFVLSVFGAEFLRDSSEANLRRIVESVVPSSPLLMISTPGYDPTDAVEKLASETLGVQFLSVALGDADSIVEAESLLNSATRSGSWLLLKNVHLALNWIETLDKRLATLSQMSRPSFRLFLSSESNSALPSTLLRRSFILMNEAAPGIQASVSHVLRTVAASSNVVQPPLERIRMHVLLSWLHAVVQERLRFIPLGWSKKYEFNDADLRFAFDVVDLWIDRVSKGRQNVRPDELPWNAIRSLLTSSIYGGKIENKRDLMILRALVESFMTADAYKDGFVLVKNEVLLSSRIVNLEDFSTWVASLPSTEGPNWIGLPISAQHMVHLRQGEHLMKKILILQASMEDESAYEKDLSGSKSADSVASGTAIIISSCNHWLDVLPATISLPEMRRDIGEAVGRFLVREIGLLNAVLLRVRQDLSDLLSVLKGQSRFTNSTRMTLRLLSADTVPADWRMFETAPNPLASAWIPELSVRHAQLRSIVDACSRDGTSSTVRVCLGKLLSPQAFITAVHQLAAEILEKPLETLCPKLVFENMDDPVSNKLPVQFIVTDLQLEGCVWLDGAVSLAESGVGTASLPCMKLTFSEAPDTSSSTGLKRDVVTMPLYTNTSRTNMLMDVVLPQGFQESTSVVCLRGCAIISWKYH